MSATRAQSLAVWFDAAEEADDYDDALRERVAASLRRMRIATAWNLGMRDDAGSGVTVGDVWRQGDGWFGKVRNAASEMWKTGPTPFGTPAEAREWCDDALREAGRVLVPEEGE